MRVAIAALADAVNVREGMINLLSAGVTTLFRESFPAPFGADLALMLELGKQDLEADGVVGLAIQVHDDAGAEIGSVQGELGWSQSETWPAQIPAAINLGDLLLPHPGRYEVRIYIQGTEEIIITVGAVAPLASV